MRSHRISLIVCGFLLSSGVLAAAPPASGPAESPADLPESLRYSYPPVPPALWDEFVREVKGAGAFEVAQALRKEAIEPQIEQWSKQWGKPLEPEFWPFLQLTGTDRNCGRLNLEILGAPVPQPRPFPTPPVTASPSGADTGVKAWIIRPRSGNQGFLVPASEAQALMFLVLRAVGSTHPLNERLATFECDSESLWAVARRILDQTGIQYDFAFNRSATDIALSMRLSNRTRFECLKMAAEAANFELSTQAFGKDCSVHDPSVGFQDVRRAYQEKRDAQPTGDEDPVRILEKRLQDEIQAVQKGRDITVGLRPRFPSTDVKVNVDESGRRR